MQHRRKKTNERYILKSSISFPKIMVLKMIKIEFKDRAKATTNISLSQDPFWPLDINTVKDPASVLAFYSMKGCQVKKKKKIWCMGHRCATKCMLFIRNSNITGYPAFLFIQSINFITEQSVMSKLWMSYIFDLVNDATRGPSSLVYFMVSWEALWKCRLLETSTWD